MTPLRSENTEGACSCARSFCPFCGRLLIRNMDVRHGYHSLCCEQLFGFTRAPTLKLEGDWMECMHPFSESSYLISLRLDPRSMKLIPSLQTTCRFFLKVPAIRNVSEANRQAENEWLTMSLARTFGIFAVQMQFVPIESGRIGLIVPRIDREVGPHGIVQHHVESLAQIGRQPKGFRSEQQRTLLSSLDLQQGLTLLQASDYPKQDAHAYILRMLFSYVFSVPACSSRKLILIQREDSTRRLGPALGLRLNIDGLDLFQKNARTSEERIHRYYPLVARLGLCRTDAERLLRFVLIREPSVMRLLQRFPMKKLGRHRMLLLDSAEKRYAVLKTLV
jgi:hypothetical protein